MFDKYTIRTSPVSTNVEITEHRAPTDESVRLLREMEKAAEDKVVHATSVRDTSISAIIHTHDDYMSASRKFKVIYSFNGKKLTTDYECGDWVNWDEWAQGLVDAVAKDIALHILEKPFKEAIISNPELIRNKRKL
jgi:hypothetical protein